MNNNFQRDNQIYGRTIIRTSKRFTGDEKRDLEIAKEILTESLPIHEKNATEETRLWNIFVNSEDWWTKNKQQRADINNKASVAQAWAISRTLNGYIFGEPIQLISRVADVDKQRQVERLSQMLDYNHNTDATMAATMSGSICGVGYKLALPASKEEVEDSGVPFLINNDIIYPQTAFVVYTDEAISHKVMGVLIGTYTDEQGNQYDKYTVWSKYYQFVLVRGLKESEDFTAIPQAFDGGKTVVYAYPLMNNRIPLVEYERNPFRKGDWEVVTDLLEMKSRLLSDRMDDIDQIIDYILVLMNCEFENSKDKQAVLKNRLIELKVTDPNNKPSVEILKNALDQSGVQLFVNYIDSVIQECVGIPTRDERGGGGQDTGQAVKYRNGFRDLENNAGLIIPKTDKAELEFLGVCIGYAKNAQNAEITTLKPSDVRLKFMRTLNDDVIATTQALATALNCGVDLVTAFTMSKSVTDPAESAKAVLDAYKRGELLFQLQQNAVQTQSTGGNDESAGKTVTENIVVEGE